MHFDQPVFNYVNRTKGGVVQELPGIYNVQVSASPTPINLVSRAKIIHYFNGGFDKVYLLQLPSVKEAGIQSETVKNILAFPKEAFSNCALVPAGKERASGASDGGVSSRQEKERERARLMQEAAAQKERGERIKRDLDDIQSSASFRIGRGLTFVPRKLRGGVQCYRDHGAGYTFRRTLYHLGLRKTWDED